MNDLTQKLEQMFNTLNDLLMNNYHLDYLLEQISTLIILPQSTKNVLLLPHLLQPQDPMFEARVLLRTKLLPDLEQQIPLTMKNDQGFMEDSKEERLVQQKVEIIQDLKMEFTMPVIKVTPEKEIKVEILLQRIYSNKR